MTQERGPDQNRRLVEQRAEFDRLIEQVRRELARQRWSAAAGWAQIAAQYAWLNHTGQFASPELEELLLTISLRGLPPLSGEGRGFDSRHLRPASPELVLHVATQAYPVGGHTQMLARWIAQDDRRRHRVVLTRQGSTPFPDKLIDRLRVPDELASLDRGRGGLLERAARLRVAAQAADLVLLHIHPYDVVPSLAFGAGGDLPPVITVNHSDHSFWIGTAISSVLLNLRDSGRDLAIARRGIEPERAAVLARPLGALTERTLSRDEAKRRFGLAPDQVLIVTAAAGSKYEPLQPPGLLELITPVFQAHPAAVLLAAGPAPAGRWAAAEAATDGRIRALGRLPDVTELHQAADGYLDSFPFASLTSMIESGSYGNPLLTYRGHPPDCGVLGADTRGLDEYLLRPSNPAELAAELTRMLADPDWRVQRGAQTRAAIVASHLGEGWRSGVDELYALAYSLPVLPHPGPAPASDGTLDRLVDLVQSRTGHSAGRAGAEREQLGLLPLAERLRGWARLARAGQRPPLRTLAPEWILPMVSRLVRRRRPPG